MVLDEGGNNEYTFSQKAKSTGSWSKTQGIGGEVGKHGDEELQNGNDLWGARGRE